MKLLFGDIVVVDEDQIGVVVKNWGGREPHVEVYVRSYNLIKDYPLNQVERYQVRHKYLDEDEMVYQQSAEMER